MIRPDDDGDAGDLRATRSSSCSTRRDCDAVLAAVGSSAQFHPELAVQPIVRRARATSRSPPSSRRTPSARLRSLAENGIAALSHARSLRRRASPPSSPGARRGRDRATEPESIHRSASPNSSTSRRSASRWPSMRSPRRRTLRHRVPYPVAVKRLDVEHKTEVGGVALDIAESPASCKPPRAHRPERVLVQRMETRTGGSDRRLSRRPGGRTDRAGRRGRHARRALPRTFAIALAPVERSRGGAMIAAGEGPRGDPRLPQPAARRCDGACPRGRGVSRRGGGGRIARPRSIR